MSAPSEIDVAWSVQSDDWPGGLPADVAALLAPPVVVSAQAVEPVTRVRHRNIRFVAPRPRTQDRHNFRETVASSAC